ncbi:hypothetical protein [Rhodococcus olei]
MTTEGVEHRFTVGFGEGEDLPPGSVARDLAGEVGIYPAVAGEVAG